MVKVALFDPIFRGLSVLTLETIRANLSAKTGLILPVTGLVGTWTNFKSTPFLWSEQVTNCKPLSLTMTQGEIVNFSNKVKGRIKSSRAPFNFLLLALKLLNEGYKKFNKCANDIPFVFSMNSKQPAGHLMSGKQNLVNAFIKDFAVRVFINIQNSSLSAVTSLKKDSFTLIEG